MPINILAVLFIVLFNILFCFPFVYPTTTESMNYNSVILVGVVGLTAVWWLVHARRNYPGPKVMGLYIHDGDPSNGGKVEVSEGVEVPVMRSGGAEELEGKEKKESDGRRFP